MRMRRLVVARARGVGGVETIEDRSAVERRADEIVGRLLIEGFQAGILGGHGTATGYKFALG